MIFRILISISLFLITSRGFSQQTEHLEIADSLFRSEKYTAAFEIYEGLYSSGQASAAMLSRMAFIKEGLGDYTAALFYLEKFYQLSGNKRALTKMAEIAESKNLTGYEQSDAVFVAHFLNSNQLSIILVLTALSVLLFILILRYTRQKERPYALAVLEVLVLASLWLFANRFFDQSNAITRSNQTIVMEGPSSGSNRVATLTKGNKIRVVKSDPVWTNVEVEGEIGYIRTNQLLLL